MPSAMGWWDSFFVDANTVTLGDQTNKKLFHKKLSPSKPVSYFISEPPKIEFLILVFVLCN